MNPAERSNFHRLLNFCCETTRRVFQAAPMDYTRCTPGVYCKSTTRSGAAAWRLINDRRYLLESQKAQ